MLEFDTTHNTFRDDLLSEPLDIQGQLKTSNGMVALPQGLGLGITPEKDFIKHHAWNA